MCNVIGDYKHAFTFCKLATEFWNNFIICVTSRTDDQIQLPSMKDIATAGTMALWHYEHNCYSCFILYFKAWLIAYNDNKWRHFET